MKGMHDQTIQRYTTVAIFLHWTIALLLIGNVFLGWSADWVADEHVRSVIDTHKSTGILILGLVLLRILWRVGHPPPPLPSGYQPWERVASHTVHGLLYVVMLALPLSGWMHDSAWKDAATHPMHWFNLFEWPRLGFIMGLEPAVKEHWHTVLGKIHTGIGYALYLLFFLHVAGALKHQFLDGEHELERMSR